MPECWLLGGGDRDGFGFSVYVLHQLLILPLALLDLLLLSLILLVDMPHLPIQIQFQIILDFGEIHEPRESQ